MGIRGSSTMHVCPQCQFNNSDTNKFCQSCGASLTHKDCSECGTTVELNVSHCPNCGALTATTWWAIIASSPTTDSHLAPIWKQRENQEEDLYLDRQNRYQIWEESETIADPSPDTQGQTRVIDLNPLQQTKLAVWLEQLQSEHNFEPEDIPIPDCVKSYVQLRDTFSTAIPHLHEALQEQDQTILLLEDRSQLPLFIDLWESDDLPTLQILFWLDQMAKLWQGFKELGCCRSLLYKQNLRLDEDQSLCLQQLYFDDSDESLNLQQLGEMWQALFSKSERTYYGPLAKLLDDVVRGKIDIVEELRKQLQTLAADEQENYIPSINPPLEDELTPSSQDAMTSSYSSYSSDFSDYSDYSVDTAEGDMPTVVLPMQIRSLDDAGCTDIGGRSHNEDNFGIESQIKKQENPLGQILKAQGLYIVCDGMGGHAAGEVASAMAVENLHSHFRDTLKSSTLPDEETVREGILAANQAIYDVNEKNGYGGMNRMGTTLVMAFVQDTKIMIAHVGDSRIYRITRKGIEQLTIDHEVGQRDIQNGVDPKDAYARRDAYQLTQALGPRNSKYVNPDIQCREINEDTLLLLCSDGLSDHNLLEDHFQTYLTPLLSSKANLDQGLTELIHFANQENGHDNITGVLVRIKVRPNMENQQF